MGRFLTVPDFPMTLRSLIATALLAAPLHAEGWWNPAWTQRQKITIDTSADTKLADATGPATVLVRLHSGNFSFTPGGNGSDFRFVSEDGSTVYPHHIEKYDDLLEAAFVWVKLPDITPGAQTSFHFYSGNPAPDAATPATEAYDADTAAVYHFGDGSGNPADSSANANNASTPAPFVQSSLIGDGLQFVGGDAVVIPPTPSLAWSDDQAMTISAWINPTKLEADAILLSRTDGEKTFRLLLNQGVPVVDVGGTRSTPGAPLPVDAWAHLAVVASGGNVKLYVNGKEYSLAQAAMPALNSAITVGGLAPDAPSPGTRFIGQMDELRFDKIARSAGWIKLAAVAQGTGDEALRLVALGQAENGEGGGEEEGHGGAMEHVMLFGDIAKNMMFDGWIAIGVCVIMIIAGWTVAIKKFAYLNSIDKGSKEFLRLWKNLSSDLTALDHSDKNSVKSLGGNADPAMVALIKKSPLYEIYHIGSTEIRHRLEQDRTHKKGLTGRSIQAIRASLDGGLVHETHRLTSGLVYLTMSIAGGPYVGLLGTVVGVMITFAIIAKSGEVNVNSIAPGIASALLATVVGLVVAIPALFIYSYLNSRIKNAIALMQVFIDEFVAKMAEFYQGSDNAGTVSKTIE
jgi:biopolymer transport protein ExbB